MKKAPLIEHNGIVYVGLCNYDFHQVCEKLETPILVFYKDNLNFIEMNIYLSVCFGFDIFGTSIAREGYLSFSIGSIDYEGLKNLVSAGEVSIKCVGSMLRVTIKI